MNIRTIQIKATFKGQNGSMGFQTGKEYSLVLTYASGQFIKILSQEGFTCDYENIITFLENWNNVSEENIFKKDIRLIKK